MTVEKRLISGITIAETWLLGCEHLLGTKNWEDDTVILYVNQPSLVRPSDRNAAKLLDDFLTNHGVFGNHTVAETIFPAYEYKKHGIEGVYQTYPDVIYPALKKHTDVSWGTYAHRILRRTAPDGKVYNPLRECIKKMQDKRPMHAAYEMGFGYGFDLATYDDDTDRLRRRGGPCLMHLSFKVLDDDRLQLTALYRLHYYVQRAYGNLLGLARLQEFVANQAGLKVGKLVCHSTLARLEGEGGWKKADVKAMLAACRSAFA